MAKTGRYVRTRDALGRTYYRDRVAGGFVSRATWERERNVRAHPPPFPVGVEVPGVPRGHGKAGKAGKAGSGGSSGGRRKRGKGGAGGGSGGGGHSGGSGSGGKGGKPPAEEYGYDYSDEGDWVEVDGEEDYE